MAKGIVSGKSAVLFAIAGAGAALALSIDASAQICTGTQPFKDAVCCLGPGQAMWVDGNTCRAMMAKASDCYSRGGDLYDMKSGICTRKSPEQKQQELMENARRVEFCGNKMSIYIEARSYQGSGFDQGRAAEYLVSRHAYGPGGQVYRESASAEATIRRWVAEVYESKYDAGQDARAVYDRCMTAGR